VALTGGRMPVSKVDICNKALGHLGAKSIAAMTESSNNAVQLSRVYNTIRDAVLAAHDWGFARVIESLAQISGETVPGWTYLYAKPALCIAIRKIFTDTGATNPDPTEYEDVRSPTSLQSAIACNDSPAYIRYTVQVDDPSLYSPDFVLAFSLALAAETAYTITGSMEMGPRLATTYTQSISEAKRNDARGKNVDPTAEESASSYETARG